MLYQPKINLNQTILFHLENKTFVYIPHRSKMTAKMALKCIISQKIYFNAFEIFNNLWGLKDNCYLKLSTLRISPKFGNKFILMFYVQNSKKYGSPLKLFLLKLKADPKFLRFFVIYTAELREEST